MDNVVYLPSELTIPSFRGRALRFIAETFMAAPPERRPGEGAAFGTWATAVGPQTGWIMPPNPATMSDEDRAALINELIERNPPCSASRLETIELERLAYMFADARRVQELFSGVPDYPPPVVTEAPPPPPPLLAGHVYQGEWYKLKGKSGERTVQIISQQTSSLKWTALTPDDDLIEVALDELEVRVSETNSCVCIYTRADQLCECAAKLVVTEHDRHLARMEVVRRRDTLERMPANAADEGGATLALTAEQEAQDAADDLAHEGRRAKRQQIGQLAAERRRQRLRLDVDP